MANPRKFSEKIALHNQKQAEETAAFEQIMREVIGATRTTQGPTDTGNWQWPYETYPPQSANGAYTKHHLSISPSLGSYRGGSLPNVNQMSNSGSSIDLQGALNNLEDMKQGRESMPERPHSRERGRHATAPHRNRQFPFDKRADVSPYGSSLYLSPPPDSSWRRTNSDSAIHQSAGNPQDAGASGQRRGTGYDDPVTARDFDQFYRDCSGKADAFGQDQLGMQDMGLLAMDNMHMRTYWDPKGGGGGGGGEDDCYGTNAHDLVGCNVPSSHLRPKSCEVPGINIYPSQDETGRTGPNVSPLPPSPGTGSVPGTMHVPPATNSNTGSLPDLTTLHFPPPLTTPLDPSEEYASSGAHPSPPSPGHGKPQQQQQMHMGGGNAPQRTPPTSPRGAGGSPSGGPSRHASPGPAPSPSSRRRAHHSSTSMVLGRGAGGQVRVPSPHHQRQHHDPPRVTVEGLTIDTNALSLDSYSGQRPQRPHQFGVYSQQSLQGGMGGGQPPGSPQMYPPASPTMPQMPPGTPHSPRPHQLYRGGEGRALEQQSCNSAPASPTSRTASSPASSPGQAKSPFGDAASTYYVPPHTAPPTMTCPSPLQRQLEQFNAEYQNHNHQRNQCFQLPDDSYSSTASPAQTNVSSGGSIFFSDSTGGTMGSLSQEAFYMSRDLQYCGKLAVSTSSDHGSVPQTPRTPTSIPDIILTGPGVSEAALLKAQDLAKCDLMPHSALAQLSSFDSADLFSAEEALRAGLDPIDLDGLQILTDPDMAVISDPAAEEAFRLDRS